jgi:ubiquinone/menaquinone biosynthesis C-methylase UbiE
MAPSEVNEWASGSHAQEYLGHADQIPHRNEGEAVVVELVPQTVRRVLDLGTGDGRLLARVKQARPSAQGVALDFSPTMLKAARARFASDPSVSVVEHNLDDPLPDLGSFDAVVSCFVIHHLVDARKRALYEEVFKLLRPGGVFCNLEHVSSPTAALHAAFFEAMGRPVESEDPSNKLISAELQLGWLSEIGFEDVDCFWKWRELALLAGVKPV